MNKFFSNERPLGIQLWSVKEEMKDNPKATLASLAESGFKRIETFEGEMGLCWGMTEKEFSSFLKDHDLSCISAHCDPFSDFEKNFHDSSP